MSTPPPDEKDSHPNRGTLGPQRSDRLWLSAEQLHDHENEPSWKAPREKQRGWSTQRIITMIVLLAILAIVIYLKVAGVI